jgi:hypothetical protein
MTSGLVLPVLGLSQGWSDGADRYVGPDTGENRLDRFVSTQRARRLRPFIPLIASLFFTHSCFTYKPLFSLAFSLI